jgi:uncharacterized repeat protein (TIGR02543 family)
MVNFSNGFRISGLFLIIFLFLFGLFSCPNDIDQNPEPEQNLTGKTYLKIVNNTGFGVNIYINDPPLYDAPAETIRHVRAGGSQQWELQPTAAGSNGDTIYFEYLIPLGSVTIPHYNSANFRMIKIVGNGINTLEVPALTNSNTTSKFLVIENDSDTDIWVQDGLFTVRPYDQQNREILAGENGVFVLPQTTTILSNYTVGGAINRRNIPATTVQPGIIYVFKYDVNSVSLYSENHFNFNDRRKIWSIPTSTSPGQYLLMGKQKLRRNPNDGIVIVGTLQYDLEILGNSAAYFALLNQYGEVTRERTFSLQGSSRVRFDEIHERQNGDFLISYIADYNADTDDYFSKTFLMCMTPDGTTRWQLDFSESLSSDFDPDNCELRIRYIVEKDNKTFAIGAEFWDGDYSASFVTEVKENVAGNGASFSWPQHYISDFADFRYCTGLVYNSALDAYITVDIFNDNGQLEGIYRVFRAADGSIIKQNAAKEYERFDFVGISQVGDKYYIFGEYLDINGEYSASILRFNADMTIDTGFDPILIHTDDGDAYFWSCDSDDKKVVFAGTIAVSGKDEVPWTYAIDRNTGVKLWENIYKDLDYNIVWNVEINSIGTLQLELFDKEHTESSLIASTDLLGRISGEIKASIPRNPSLTVTIPSVTVTYNINGGTGTTPAAQTVTAGNSVTLAGGSGFTRSGYTFVGWNTDSSGTGTNYNAGSSYTPTGNITLYAKWNTVPAYTVTYNINSGTGTTPAVQTVYAGNNVTLAGGSGLSRSGYTFGGWNTNTSGTGTNYNAGSSYTPTGNITLYAKWDVTYTVTFNANGATSGTAPSAHITGSGSTITLPSGGSLSRTNYIFGGWNTNTSGTGTNYSADSSYIVTGNITLYAKWEDASTVWTVKFETNGGSPIGDVIVLKNTAVSRPSPDSTKTGYTLDGWHTNMGLTAPYNFSSVVTGDITLYAKWNVITYTVAYNANGGTGTTANSSHTYDVDRTLTSNGFTRTGYTFAGWARTSTGAVEFTNGQSVRNLTTTAGSTVTLYANWNPINYTVTYNINSGSGTTPSTQTAAYGSSITLPSGSGLSRTSYNLGGWNTNTSGTGTNYSAGSSYTVTGNVTLYAKWDVVTNVPGATLAAKLSWLQTYALSNVNYTVEVTTSESISPTTLSYSGRTNIGITLKGMSAIRTISLSSNGAMFTVESGVTLTLDNNITLQGRSNNNDAIIVVNASGRLVMNMGSLVTGNTSSLAGGGVYVAPGGTFTMNGGTVSGNTVSLSAGRSSAIGGGVCVDGIFTMSGGTISGNTASSPSGSGSAIGGGVYVYGTFTMSGGTISGNTTSGYSGIGGGVYVSGGTFTMSGGTISGNTASGSSRSYGGGGVRVNGGTFTKTGGTIYGYTARDSNSNVVKNSSGAVQSNLGHAMYATGSNSVVKRKETTAGTGVNMSFNGSNGTYSGSWDN